MNIYNTSHHSSSSHMDNHAITLLNVKTKRAVSFDFQKVCRLKIKESNSNLEMVSDSEDAYHARITASENGTFTIDPTEGTVLSINGVPAAENSPISDGDWFFLKSTLYQIKIPQRNKTKNHIPESSQYQLDNSQGSFRLSIQERILVGRQENCDLIIESPLISREHAKITRESGQLFIEDCESTNGTFVNAVRISKKQEIRAGDQLGFAGFEYFFDGICICSKNIPGLVSIEVHHLTKEITGQSGKGKRILDDISFVINPGEFVGIFGTSGSGKSTLLDALNGRRKASSGGVFYNGLDLYEAYDLFKATIGYVPQQDIVHRRIKMQNALKYTAEMRLPLDTSPEERKENVAKVLEKVGLSEKSALPVDTPVPLSGGQFKRVSLAVELVSNPNVLFLDEVTSGLDAGNDKKMMQLFRGLADNRKTVVCVTHTLENIETCHLVLLLHQGKLIFYGPPEAVTRYFSINRLTDIYELLDRKSTGSDYWQKKFHDSELFQRFVEQRLQKSTPRDINPVLPAQNKSRRYTLKENWIQTRTLISRYCELILSDRRNLLILILQSPIIAIILGVVYRADVNPAVHVIQEHRITLILVIACIWFGCLNSVRELVKELPIYTRERAVNLKLGPYLISKLVPLSILGFIQCILLLCITRYFILLPGNALSKFLILYMTNIAAMTMGLCVSSIVNSTDKALAIAPMLLIPQVILSGAIFDLHQVGLVIAKSSMISYWSYDAMISALSEGAVDARGIKKIIQISDSVENSLYCILFLSLLFVIGSAIGLKFKDYNQK